MDRETLDTILEAHYTWLDAAGQEGARGDLSGAALSGMDLTGTNFEQAKMVGVQLDGADLEGAVLEWADLTGANLTGANLKGAQLRFADLEGADLEGARGAGADFYKANVLNAKLDTQVNRILTHHQEWVDGKGTRSATLREAELVGAYHRLNGVEDRGSLAAKLGQIAQRADELATQSGGSKEAYYDFSPDLLGQRNAGFSAAPSRWETIKATAGKWVGRVTARFARAAQAAPDLDRDPAAPPHPEAHVGRGPAEGPHLASAERTPPREDAQAAWAQILAHPEETRAAIAQMADPADRAKAERLLAIVEQTAAGRQRPPARAAAAERDR